MGGFIQEAVDAFWEKLTGVFSWASWIPDYLYLAKWIALGFLIGVGLSFLVKHFGDVPVIGKVLRWGSGIIILEYIAFLIGLVLGFLHGRNRD